MSTNVIAGGSTIPFKILVGGLSELHSETRSGEQVGLVGLKYVRYSDDSRNNAEY